MIASLAACASLLIGVDTAQAMPAVGEPGTLMIIYGPTPVDCGECGWLKPQSDRALIDGAQETGWF